MIDWLAGSQQTDVRPPDQPTHPRRDSLSTPGALVLLKHPLPALARPWRRPWSRLAQKARDTMHDCHPLDASNPCLARPTSPLLSSPHPGPLPLFFFLDRALRPAILSYRYPFNPFSSEPACPRCCVARKHSCAGFVQKPTTGQIASAIESLKVDLPGQCIEAAYLFGWDSLLGKSGVDSF